MFDLKIDSAAKSVRITFDIDLASELKALEKWLEDDMPDTRAKLLFRRAVLQKGLNQFRDMVAASVNSEEDLAAKVKELQDNHAAMVAKAPVVDCDAVVADSKIKAAENKTLNAATKKGGA